MPTLPATSDDSPTDIGMADWTPTGFEVAR